jgi:iron(III) transport system permease protein
MAIAGVLLLLVGLPLLLPLATLGRSPAAWSALLETTRLALLARNTLLLVCGTLALAIPPGVAAAVLLYRTDLPLRRLLRWLTVLTLFVPLPLFASGWQAALGSGGWLALPAWTTPAPDDPDRTITGIAWKPWAQGLSAAIWIHAAAGLPWVILLVGQGLRWVERDLEEDALTVAGPWFVLRRVTLRRGRAALAAAMVWVALLTATEITVTDMLQVRTFAEEVYNQYVRPEADASATGLELVKARAVAVSLPATVFTALLVFSVVRRWESNLPPLERLSIEPKIFALGWWRWPALLATLLGVGVLLGIPLGSLVWKAGLDPAHGFSATIATSHVRTVFLIRGGLVVDSLLLALGAGTLSAILALLTCWLATGSRWFRYGALVLVVAIWAMPGPVIGVGLKQTISLLLDLTESKTLALALYHGPSYLPIYWAHVLRFFPAAVAILWPVVRLLPRELIESARVDGAGPSGELRHIVWPLTRLACLRAALAVAVLALGELSAGKLVETAGAQTFAHEIFSQMHYGVTNDLAALCLVLLGAVAAGAVFVAGAGWLLKKSTAWVR